MASLRLIACAIALAGCYDIPQPECGFQCGAPATIGGEGSCPDGYSCLGDRCRLVTERPFSCPEIMDPPIVTDITPPSVMARSPMPNAVDVPLDTLVLVTFGEDVTGVDASTFGLESDTGFVNGEITIASPGRAFRFTPTSDLKVNTVYEVVLGTAIRDDAGNRLPETRWSFATIEDHTGPTVVGSIPPDGAIDVALTGTLSVIFDEPVMGITASSVQLEDDGTILPTTLSLPLINRLDIAHDPLAGETVYTIILGAGITDLQGNALIPTTITFTTRETTPPTIVNREPPPDAVDVALDAVVSITFSELVTPDQDISLSTSAALVDTNFSDTFNTDGTYRLTLTPTALLAPATVYTVNIGLVRDLSNNPATFPSYTFTTAP